MTQLESNLTMKNWNHLARGFTLVAAIFVASANATAQITEARAIEIAHEAASKIGADFDEDRTTVQYSSMQVAVPYVMVSSNDVLCYLDLYSGTIRMLINTKRVLEIADDKSLSPDKFFETEAEAWLLARRKLVSLQVLNPRLKNFMFTDLSQRKVESNRRRIQFIFCERPFGYKTNGFGNNIKLTLDSTDGEIVELIISSGWIYEEPSSRLISAESAKQLAADMLRGSGSAVPEGDPTVSLLFLPSNREFGSVQGEALRRSKRLRLCYAVAFDGYLVYVDSGTGVCLGGRVLKH